MFCSFVVVRRGKHASHSLYLAGAAASSHIPVVDISYVLFVSAAAAGSLRRRRRVQPLRVVGLRFFWPRHFSVCFLLRNFGQIFVKLFVVTFLLLVALFFAKFEKKNLVLNHQAASR